MSIILFAIIGEAINAGIAYWICLTLYSIFRVIKIICEVMELCN